MHTLARITLSHSLADSCVCNVGDTDEQANHSLGPCGLEFRADNVNADHYPY